jgi:hypothetical protein
LDLLHQPSAFAFLIVPEEHLMLTSAADAPVASVIVLQIQENECDQRLGIASSRLSLNTEKSPIYAMCVMTRKMPYPLFRPPQPYAQLCTPISTVPDGLIVASGS